jgi:hypothetical protein
MVVPGRDGIPVDAFRLWSDPMVLSTNRMGGSGGFQEKK